MARVPSLILITSLLLLLVISCYSRRLRFLDTKLAGLGRWIEAVDRLWTSGLSLDDHRWLLFDIPTEVVLRCPLNAMVWSTLDDTDVLLLRHCIPVYL